MAHMYIYICTAYIPRVQSYKIGGLMKRSPRNLLGGFSVVPWTNEVTPSRNDLKCKLWDPVIPAASRSPKDFLLVSSEWLETLLLRRGSFYAQYPPLRCI